MGEKEKLFPLPHLFVFRIETFVIMRDLPRHAAVLDIEVPGVPDDVKLLCEVQRPRPEARPRAFHPSNALGR